ncbi:MAG: NERD domain-containing protein [Gammaproteobacteria bacterium]|nr:NERD domain-containing protein [Gammaproteobacteria bacterium]
MANSDAANRDGVRAPGPPRGQAGEYLKAELLVQALGPLAGLFLGAGVLLGAVLHGWYGWTPIFGVGIASLAGAAYLRFWLKHRGERLRKGHLAERKIGRALEQATTAKGCAVAHNVTGLMASGDIDHIVATRQCVRVIETKYRRVPPEKLGGVLSRLRACRRRVEALLPGGTPVRACLVLAYEGRGVKAERDGVEVFNDETFREGLLSTLRAEQGEAAEAAGIDERVAGTIWRLGLGEGASAVEAAEDRDRPEGHDVDEVRRRHPRAYKRWTAEEDRRLRDLHEEGLDEADLAREFGRQPSAIRSRLGKEF